MAYIRRIEIQGFKSFGTQKVTLSLSKGLTAIVGQNGSGKSNILDAVCFVLGRLSSKSLRAENFASLVFHGADGRQPAKFCRAALVFDNHDRQLPIDADEVVISREVDPSGVSLYRLNGKRCTRTEILDTIGVAGLHPEGHNVVLQNELANVVAMSPAEIRQIVEGVAGISVFDEKKRQIEGELEKVDANLQLVQIRTEEIRQEYARLEKDRSDALRWREITAAIHRIERDISFAELTRIEEKLAEMKNGYASYTQAIEELKAQKQKATERFSELEQSAKTDTARIRTLDRELHNKEIEITRLREKLNGLTLTTEKLARQVKSLSTSVAHIRASETETQSRCSQLEEFVSKLKDEETSLIGQITPLRNKLSQLAEGLSPPDANFLTIKNEITNLTEVIEQKQSELGEFTALHRVGEQTIKNLQQQIEESLTYLEEQEKDVESVRIRHADVEAAFQETRDTLANLQEQHQANLNLVLEHRTEQTQLSQLIQATKEDLLATQTRLETIRELQKFGSTRQATIDAVLRHVKEQQIPGVHGTLGSLGKTSTKYAVALEVAGGGRLDHIVVDDEETAARCIEYLKRSRIGRATFIPLRSIKTNPATFQGGQKDILGNAIDLLSFDEKFRPAFEYAFGRTIIVENLEVARVVKVPGIRKITIDGDIVEPNRTLRGGYYKPTSSLTLEEEARIPEIQRKLKELQELFEKGDHEYHKLKATSEKLEERLRKTQHELVLLERRSTAEAETLREKEEALTVFKASVDKLHEALRGEEAARTTLAQKQQSHQTTIVHLTEKRQVLQKRLAELERSGLDPGMNRVREQLDQLEQQLGEVRLQLTAKTSEMNHTLIEHKRLGEDLTHSSEELERTQEDLDQSDQEITAIQAQLADIEQEHENFGKEINRVEQELESNESEQRQLTQTIDVLIDRINEEQNNRSKIEGRFEYWEERYAAQQAKVEGIEPPLAPISPSRIPLLRKEHAALTDERDELGLINQKAVERFDEVRGAFEEILERERHIRQEREAILDALRRAEEEKFKVFMTAFMSISSNFSEVYQQLTSGEGHLELENPENPFLGGIRMKVRPAGKRVQYLDALSGGEKALTALAFIFGLQLHQPAPFYFLDEIDETLDPNNADRVARLLDNVSRDSQFIIISHNEITIRRANTLLGVAMVDGVSRVFSVKFEEGLLLIDGK